jgi:hypothetical protein
MVMGYPAKVSGVTETFKKGYLIPCPKVCRSIRNFDHGRSPDSFYVSGKAGLKYVDFKTPQKSLEQTATFLKKSDRKKPTQFFTR